jgi:dynactin 1
LRALKELNDFKVKAQDTIRGLQLKLKEAITENDKLNKDRAVDKETNDKEKDKLKKDYDKEISKLQKEIEKIKEEYEEQLSSTNDNLEMVTLDREIAEEKAETLEQELEKVKGQLNILEMSTSNKSADTTTSTSSTSDKVTEEEMLSLMEQNDKLKEALLKLRDMSLAEKQEKDKRIKDLERENKQIPSLQGK